MVNLPVYNLEGKEISSVGASDAIFANPKGTAVVHQAVVWHLASKRQGTASAKTRAEVSGGGKKPWAQKGTGRARAGSTRSPLWRGGGVVFGPKPRDYSFALPKKVRQLALKVAFSDRVKAQSLRVVEALEVASAKTKDAAKLLAPFLNKDGELLIIDAEVQPSLSRAVRNLPGVKLVSSQAVNVYDVVSSKTILITKKALQVLEERMAS